MTPKGDRLKLELYNAGNVMAAPVLTLGKLEKVSCVARALLDTEHGGFPVVEDSGDEGGGTATFVGLITRAELLIILLRYWESGKEASGKIHA